MNVMKNKSAYSLNNCWFRLQWGEKIHNISNNLELLITEIFIC